MSRTVEFHRLEGYRQLFSRDGRPMVYISFQTQQHGILQVEYRKDKGLQELRNEPDLYMFTQKDQNYIKNISEIVWRIVHDPPAAKDRFEKS